MTDTKPTTGSNIGNSGGTSPEILETTPQNTAPTESTGTTPPEATQPETTQPVEPTDETTTPTVMEEHSASEKENSGAWIVWLVVGTVVVADTVIGVIYLKKRKKNQQ